MYFRARLRPQKFCFTHARSISTTRIVKNVGPSTSRPRIIFSGIQPTGIPHLGNYLGALLNWVQLQNNAAEHDQLLFSIVGWHALTLPQDPKALRASRTDMLAVLLAIGIDPKRSIIFHQDQNQDHLELFWVLNCLTSMGKLKRMTTWKSRFAASQNASDDSKVDESHLNAGLFTYPVLQAADILAYQATHVPVGEDQQQHLELSRDLADAFNRATKSKLFPLPQHMITPSRRILSLRDPSSKMSKSAPDAHSRILLTDTLPQISTKLRAAVTDSTPEVAYDPAARPGTSNLMTILAACEGTDVAAVAARMRGRQHAYLKAQAAEAIDAFLAGPRAEFARLRGETAYLEGVAREGAERARARSAGTLARVRALVGLA